jgi:hypothetical protein
MAYQVKFVNPARNYQLIKAEIDAAYFEVMSNGDLIDRGQLKSFEKNLAAFVGTSYAVGLNSGYDALHISLRAAGIGPGDEVIVPAHTFVATCSAVVNVGATPMLVDVAQDFNIDVDKIEEVISEKTKGIIPVHLSGIMADMPRIMAIAEKYNLVVVEDACQSLGSSINGKGAGSWGLTGCAIMARTGRRANIMAMDLRACWIIYRRRFWTSNCATCQNGSSGERLLLSDTGRRSLISLICCFHTMTDQALTMSIKIIPSVPNKGMVSRNI